MVGSPRGTGARSPGRRARDPLRSGSSCDLLLDLVRRPVVADVLRAHGVAVDALERARSGLERESETEPVDWRLRLEQRGGQGPSPQGELELLLAIVRSADSHAYRLLECVGVSCTRLRKEIIDRMRDLGSATVLPQNGRRSSALPPVRATAPPRSARRAPASPRPEPSARVVPLRAELAVEHAASEAESIPRSPTPAPRRRDLPPAIDRDGLPPLHGREAELGRVADALLRAFARAPLLVGPHGSGRTLLARHLARVLPRPVFRLDLGEYDGEETLREDLGEIAAQGGIAIVDELDRVAGDVPPEFLGVLCQAWGSGAPPIVTLASQDSQARLAHWIPGILETLDVIQLAPLSGEPLLEAVAAAAPHVLLRHGLELSADARLGELTRLADRYLSGLAMPGRALDLLDLACARTVREKRREVTRATCIDIVCERSGIPRERIEGFGNQTLLDLEHHLARRVVGHEHVVATVAALIRRNRAGFASCRPVATVLLLGTSGVGKTEIAKALAAALYDRNDALVRLDMSEYAEAHAVARIVGAPPGYVGHEQGGALTDPLLRRPHCVVLLDEIEKAHRDVHQLLLQVFDEGHLTDGRGRTVDFSNAVLIMTSNLGSEHMDPRGELREDQVLATARRAFPVELWNRIEAPLVMGPLSDDEMRVICKRLAKASSERLFHERGIRYSLSERACAELVAIAGRDAALGARPLRHLLSRRVESLVADAVLRGFLRAGTQTMVDHDGSEFLLR